MEISTKSGQVEKAKNAYGGLFSPAYDGKNYCSHCGKDCEVVVVLPGDAEDYAICPDCLNAALDLLK